MSTAEVADDYVLTLNSDSSGEWMKRVPGERFAVLQEQRLWRIPDNWERFARIANDHEADEILFRIPETVVNVVLLDLEHGGGARSGYRVERVGSLDVELTDTPDKSALIELMDRLEHDEEDDTPTAVKDTLQALLERWEDFESRYRMYYDKWSDKRAWNAFRYNDGVTFESWSIEPWENRQNKTIGHLINEVCRSRGEVSELVNKMLTEAGVVSPSPAVTVTVQDKQLPMGFHVQALVEAGCTASEAVDYLMQRFEDKSHFSLDSIRDADESTVRENVRAARKALNH